MSRLEHAYFGALDTSVVKQSVDVIWEREFSLNGVNFDVWLWASPSTELDATKLDAYAALLNNLNTLDATARQSLREFFADDRAYIDFHVEEIENSEVMQQLLLNAGDAEITEQAFVARMQLSGIGLWHDATSAPVILDYVIDPDASDEILAVKTEQDGNVTVIDWES